MDPFRALLSRVPPVPGPNFLFKQKVVFFYRFFTTFSRGTLFLEAFPVVFVDFNVLRCLVYKENEFKIGLRTCKAIFGAIGPKVQLNIDTFVKIGSRDLTSFGDKKVVFLNFLKVALDLFRSC